MNTGLLSGRKGAWSLYKRDIGSVEDHGTIFLREGI